MGIVKIYKFYLHGNETRSSILMNIDDKRMQRAQLIEEQEETEKKEKDKKRCCIYNEL